MLPAETVPGIGRQPVRRQEKGLRIFSGLGCGRPEIETAFRTLEEPSVRAVQQHPLLQREIEKRRAMRFDLLPGIHIEIHIGSAVPHPRHFHLQVPAGIVPVVAGLFVRNEQQVVSQRIAVGRSARHPPEQQNIGGVQQFGQHRGDPGRFRGLAAILLRQFGLRNSSLREFGNNGPFRLLLHGIQILFHFQACLRFDNKGVHLIALQRDKERIKRLTIPCQSGGWERKRIGMLLGGNRRRPAFRRVCIGMRTKGVVCIIKKYAQLQTTPLLFTGSLVYRSRAAKPQRFCAYLFSMIPPTKPHRKK